MKVVIVGQGKIGKRLGDLLLQRGHNVIPFSLRKNKTEDFVHIVGRENPNAVAVAISNKDEGEAELGYFLDAFGLGIPVVTCAKCAIAYHGQTLRPYVNMIGCSAAVGGGTGMLVQLAWRSASWDRQDVEILASINGSFNLLGVRAEADVCSVIEAAEGVAAKAVADGCAESGVHDGPSFLIEEGKDILRKTCTLLWKITNGEYVLTPRDFEKVCGRQLEDIRDPCRFIVSFRNHIPEARKEPEVLDGGFKTSIGPWQIVGGWRPKDALHDGSTWLPHGVGNVVRVKEEVDTPFIYSGAGAGVNATADAMYNDLCHLVGIRYGVI